MIPLILRKPGSLLYSIIDDWTLYCIFVCLAVGACSLQCCERNRDTTAKFSGLLFPPSHFLSSHVTSASPRLM